MVVRKFLVDVRNLKTRQCVVEAPCAVMQVILISIAAIDEQAFQSAQAGSRIGHHRQRIMGGPIGPAFRDQFGGFGIAGQSDPEWLSWIGIVRRRHGEKHERVNLALARLLRLLEMLDESRDRAFMFSKIIQSAGKVAAIDEVERQVAGMTRGGGAEHTLYE